MVFNGAVVLFLLIVLCVWASLLTVLFLRMRSHYNRLTQGISSRGLGDVLEEILKRERRLQDRTIQLEHAVEILSTNAEFYIAKVGLVRFNPFSDTGGTQSFTVALLDGKNNGLVMTSLYGRTGNRWYVKEVKAGLARGVELSKEEHAAIERAQMLNKKIS